MVMIRPERIRLATAELAARPNGVSVTLVEMIFQGPVVRFVLRDGAGSQIIAHVDDEERPSGLAPGAHIWASWDPSAARLLPPRPPSRGDGDEGTV
jgi:putative spermidine/putrescine transport system ATP-binding protein